METSHLDRQAISESYASFSDAANQHDWSAMADLFTEAAKWNTKSGQLGFQWEGRKAIREGLERNTSDVEVLHYQVAPPVVELIASDRARARVAMQELLRIKATGEVKHLFGVYADDLVKHDGRWRFASRSFTLRWRIDGIAGVER